MPDVIDACNLLNEMYEADSMAVSAMTSTSWDARLPHAAVEYTPVGEDSLRFNVLSVLNGLFGPTGQRISVNVVEGRTVFIPAPCNPDDYKDK